MIEPCQTNFVRKLDFNHFLRNHADAGMNAIRHLCLEYKTAYSQIRSLGLSNCVADKLASLLLEWSKNGVSNNGSVNLTNSFSHEAIAEMIGTTRETVTRLFKDFRERELISIDGSNLCIRDKYRLEATIGNGRKSKPVQ
ncbi:MAG: winged helix-turn-helix domain-containing protein [Acidobacteria bacterium]|nr:winged helix-turn-helix domain-containing protein [Acidobacteriota bacterium]